MKNKARANNTAHTAGVSRKHQNDANESFPKHWVALRVETLDVARITAAPTTPAYTTIIFGHKQRERERERSSAVIYNERERERDRQLGSENNKATLASGGSWVHASSKTPD